MYLYWYLTLNLLFRRSDLSVQMRVLSSKVSIKVQVVASNINIGRVYDFSNAGQSLSCRVA
jgi:hypothetical protein